jgi:transcriptional regulator with XRE-family HTH domain
MLGSSPNPEAGRRLRLERTRVCLSTREVERLSQQIAQEKKSQDYSISHTWLTDVENGKFTPSIYKLFSLSVIYKRKYNEILSFFGIPIRDLGREQMSVPLPRTHLIGEVLPQAPYTSLPEDLREKLRLEKTNLVSRLFHRWGGIPADLLKHMDQHMLYGYVGMKDFTLYPFVRPGSFVEIDARQRRIDTRAWPNMYERPIYFVELRGGYACSWCELRDRHLFLVPSPQAPAQVRQVRVPTEAEVLGRVTAVSMRIA